MELETSKILINAAITLGSVLLIFIANITIKYINRKHGKNIPTLETDEIIQRILEAEKILGKGQGAAKLNYVLNKLGKKDKKTTNRVNEIHGILNSATKIAEKESKENK